MREYFGDIIKDKLGKNCTIAITTNGFIKNNGAAVMGRGIAKQISQRFPGIEYRVGAHIYQEGNIVNLIGTFEGTKIITFPVKPKGFYVKRKNQIVKHMRGRIKSGNWCPGWAAVAWKPIIKNSAYQLRNMIDKEGWENVYLPKPGCGAGELEWKEIKPMLEEILDDRVIISDFKRR